jgi:hypothetical protein
VTRPPDADGGGLADGAAAPEQPADSSIATSSTQMPRRTMVPGRDARR